MSSQSIYRMECVEHRTRDSHQYSAFNRERRCPSFAGADGLGASLVSGRAEQHLRRTPRPALALMKSIIVVGAAHDP